MFLADTLCFSFGFKSAFFLLLVKRIFISEFGILKGLAFYFT